MRRIRNFIRRIVIGLAFWVVFGLGVALTRSYLVPFVLAVIAGLTAYFFLPLEPSDLEKAAWMEARERNRQVQMRAEEYDARYGRK